MWINVNKKDLFISISLFLLGVFLSYNLMGKAILEAFERVFHKQLDHSYWGSGFSIAAVECMGAGVSWFVLKRYGKTHSQQTGFFLSIGWITLFFLYLIRNIVNIPMLDDYTLLAFLNDYIKNGNIGKLFAQRDEDREFFTRALSLMLYYLKVFDFRILILFADLCLVGIVALLYRSISGNAQRKTLFFLCLVVVTFQFEYYEATTFAQASLYHTCSIFFAFASLFFLMRTGWKSFLCSIFFAALAVLNIGNGFIVLAAGAAALLLKKQFGRLMTWLIFAGMAVTLYFYSYSTSREYFGSDFQVTINPLMILRSFAFSCTFLGSACQFLYQGILPVTTGVLVWVYFIHLTYKKYYNKNPALYFFLFFLLGSSPLPMLMRSQSSVQDALAIRYGLYSILAICCSAAAWFENRQEVNAARLFSIALAYHISANIFFYPAVAARKQQLITMLQSIRNGEKYIRPVNIVPDNGEQIMYQAVKEGYFYPAYR